MSIPVQTNEHADVRNPRVRRIPVPRWLRKPPLADAITLGVIVLLLAAGLLAPLIAPYDPNRVSLSEALLPASLDHPLGTDANGRDLLSRLLWGARTALLGPLLVVAVSTVVGTALAVFAAWRGGFVDALISRALDMVFAFPALLLALISTVLLGPGLFSVALALSISYVPYIARVVRSAAIKQRQMPFVQASVIQGFSGYFITMRNILPNVLPLVFAQAAIVFGWAVVDLAAISYLGLGVQPPTADWGQMIANGQASILRGYPEESVYAGALIVILVVCVTLLSDRLSERWEASHVAGD